MAQPARRKVDAGVIAALLRVCNSSTINIDESPANAIRAIVCICLKFIDKRRLVDAVVPDTFVDWGFVQESGTRAMIMGAGQGGSANGAHGGGSGGGGSWNLLGDSAVWMGLLENVSFPDTTLPDTALRRAYPPLWCILNSIRESRAYEPCAARSVDANGEPRDVLTFSDVCKLCIAINLEGVASRHMSDQYISSRIKRRAYNLSSNLMSALADERHEAGVYLSTMEFLVRGMVVDEDAFRAHIAHHREVRRSRQQVWAVKYVEAGKSRPSMRDVARRVHEGGGHVSYAVARGGVGGAAPGGLESNDAQQAASAVGTAPYGDASSVASMVGGGGRGCASSVASWGGGGVDVISFSSYCDAVRFPISMSRLLRLRCYLLASQGHLFDYASHAHRIVPHDVARSLAQNSITFPDVQCLCNGIESLTMNGAPFEEINDFRQRCFASFAINQRRGLTLTQVLHLYVAAYQKRDVWKQCWKRIYPIMSAQIARDLEDFVASTPFAVEHFMRIMKTSTPFVG